MQLLLLLLRKQNVMTTVYGSHGCIFVQSRTVLFRYLDLYVQHRVGQIDVIFTAPTNIEFDGTAVIHGGQKEIFYPGTTFDAGLCRRYGKRHNSVEHRLMICMKRCGI